jgi:hypothetical protein
MMNMCDPQAEVIHRDRNMIYTAGGARKRQAALYWFKEYHPPKITVASMLPRLFPHAMPNKDGGARILFCSNIANLCMLTCM